MINRYSPLDTLTGGNFSSKSSLNIKSSICLMNAVIFNSGQLNNYYYNELLLIYERVNTHVTTLTDVVEL